MLEELSELENIGTRYSQISTLLDTVCQEYFSDAEPNMVQIQVGYESITDLLFLAEDLIIEQNQRLAEATNRLFNAYKGRKKPVNEVKQPTYEEILQHKIMLEVKQIQNEKY